MKTAKYALSILMLLSVVLAGVWLPEYFSRYTQKSELEQIRTETIEPYIAAKQNSATLLQKLALLNKDSFDVMQVRLSSGDYDVISANERFLTELEILKEFGILPDMDYTEKIGLAITVGLFMDKNDPSLGTTCWEITVGNENYTGTFLMDDETGKILRFVVRIPNYDIKIGRNAIIQWGKYLGLESRNIEYFHMSSTPDNQGNVEDYNNIEELGEKVHLVSHDTQVKESTVTAGIHAQYTYELAAGDEAVSYQLSLLDNGYSFGSTEGHIPIGYYRVEEH